MILISLLWLKFTTLAFSATAVMESGRLTLTGVTTMQELTSDLMAFDRFTDIYLQETAGMGLNRCSSWPDYAVIKPTHIDLCTETSRMAVRVRVITRFTAKAKAALNANQLGCVNYHLKFMKGSSPGMLLDNVDSLTTDFCLEKDGRTLSYTSYIVQGPNKGLMYNFIYNEIKNMVRPMLRTVQGLAR